MTYLRVIVNQKVNILMKTKTDINWNRKCEIKSHFAFSSTTLVFKKAMMKIKIKKYKN